MTFPRVALVWLAVVSISGALKLPSGHLPSSAELVNMRVSNAKTVTRNKRSIRNPLLESFTVEFQMPDHTNVHVTLNRNKQMNSPIPMGLINGNGNVIDLDHQDLGTFYQNSTHLASFHLECVHGNADGCLAVELMGSFHHQGDFYHVETTCSSSDLLKEDENKWHLSAHVTKQNPEQKPVTFLNDYRVSPNTQRIASPSHTMHPADRRVKRAPGENIVELYTITDYSVYKMWYDLSSAVANDNRGQWSIDMIKKFTAYHINGIDVRYQNSDINVKIHFAGLLMENLKNTSLTENLKSGDVIDADVVLERLNNWSSTTNYKFDHVMLITRYDIARNGSTGVTGYAYLDTMCTTESVSVVEDSFNFIMETVAAHEIGHSLNANHDGLNLNGCQDRGFIMSISTQVKTGEYAYNPFEFSTCSVNEIKQTLTRLAYLPQGSCLQIKNSAINPEELQSSFEPVLGQTINPDVQCTFNFGPSSYFCRQAYGTNSYESICTGMLCSNGPPQCTYIIPADGTTCGDRKWCQTGECTYDSSAPSVANANCLFGDVPVPFIIEGRNYSCQEVANTFPYQCYSMDKHCCASCSYVDTGDPKCPYGDRQPNLCSSVKANTCYYESNRQQCCQTCKDFETGIQGCEYGDRILSCENLRSQNCYGNNLGYECCGVCEQWKTNIADCLYGDKLTGCRKEDCQLYNVTIRQQCCETCYVSIKVTTTEKSPGEKNNKEWMIPTFASLGAVVLIIIVVVIIYWPCRKSNNFPEMKYNGPMTISRNEMSNTGPYRLGGGIQNRAYQSEPIQRQHTNLPRQPNVSNHKVPLRKMSGKYDYIDESKVKGPTIRQSQQLQDVNQVPYNTPTTYSIKADNIYMEIVDDVGHTYQPLNHTKDDRHTYLHLNQKP